MQPWRLLGAADFDAIARALQPLVQGWVDAWLPDAVFSLTVTDAHAHPSLCMEASEQLLVLADAPGGAVLLSIMYGNNVLAMLQTQALAAFGVPAAQRSAGNDDALPVAVAHYQLRDLATRLARQPLGSARRHACFSEDRTQCPVASKGSGSVLLLLSLDRYVLRVCLPHDTVAAWCRRPVRGAKAPPIPLAPLVPTAEALADRRLALRLQAGSATLSLADLLSLQPGDVVRLDTTLDQPMELVSAQGAAIGRGYLGLRQGRPVIQLCS